VFPADTALEVQRDGDWFCAPGIGDNTRGLVVLLGVLQLMESHGLETRDELWFIGNVGEEGLGDLRGVKHLFREGAPTIDALVAIDGGSLGRVVYGGVGSHRYRIVFTGPGGHSWGAFGTANPAHALGRAISKFVTTAPAAVGEGEKATWNVGRIGGGTSVNSVPYEAWAEVDLRSGEQARIDALDATLHDAVSAALQAENAQRTEGEPLTVEVRRVGTRPAARSDESSPLVQRAMAALSTLGVEGSLSISSTDANLPLSLGIPAVTLSRGGETRRAHSLDECWSGENAALGVQAALLTLLSEAGLP
jgi:acetylornithine deacetylase/succinyl-diaminopimelate desuccinylase-like protein